MTCSTTYWLIGTFGSAIITALAIFIKRQRSGRATSWSCSMCGMSCAAQNNSREENGPEDAERAQLQATLSTRDRIIERLKSALSDSERKCASLQLENDKLRNNAYCA